MKHHTTHLPSFFVKPGDYHFSKKPEMVITILGSCVSVIMYDLENKISFLSHCVLPTQAQYDNEGEKNQFKFVDSAIYKMLKVFEKYEIPKKNIVVKLFGGSDQLGSDQKRDSIGKQNSSKALEILTKEKLNILSMDIGGTEGRKIYLTSHTGEVLLSRLGNTKSL